jgi:5-formyltetrahydrofolate cyclo-ligase
VLSEAAFISNPPEEALLVDPAFQAVEAVPRGTTDLPVDALVTEERVTRFPRG